MRTYFGLLIVALSLLLAGGAQAQTWTEVRPQGGGYRVEMPKAAQFGTDQIPMPDGRKATIYQAIGDAGEIVYVATYVDYPPDIIALGTPETHLTNTVNGTATGHTLGPQRRITIGGNPGRDYVVHRADNISMAVRNALVGNRLYQILVIGKRGIEQAPDTRRFLESFALIAQ